MQRARAGERFLVTRRGKPYVRLIPAFDQAELILDEQGREPGAPTLDAA
jgi:prevent-host-death family protein